MGGHPSVGHPDLQQHRRDQLRLRRELPAALRSGSGFGQIANFPAAQISTHQAFAGNVAADTLLGLNLNPAGLNWTPKAGSPATTGAGTVPAAKVAGYFGGTWTDASFIGAADPAGAAWWQGWTAYNIN